jgi:hypothetical protein
LLLARPDGEQRARQGSREMARHGHADMPGTENFETFLTVLGQKG